MTTFEANNTIQENVKLIDVQRPVANFPPSIWGDRFLSFSLDNTKLEAYAKAMTEPKEELKRLIADINMTSNSKLSLINSLYRLGLNYLFFEEINSELDKLFNKFNLEDCHEMDLYTISLNFLVFRQHGYKLSCDVFNKFKDFGSGKFKEYIVSDVKGMLSFYECVHLRIHGESILDEALAFTESKLKGVVDTLEGNLERQVKRALAFPSHLGLPIVEARLYYENYQEECSTYDPLRKLAIAHFNYFQLLHKHELQILSKWYKDMKFQTIAPYTRDKLPELYLWILAVYLEPHYSESRIITTKILQLVLVLDDTFDAYATIEELRLLTNAINRWDMSAMEQLPEYIKPFYQIILNEYAEFEKQLINKEGRANVVNASKRAFQELATSYLKEAEWRHSGKVPTFEEYLENGMISSTYNVLEKSVIIGMGEIVNEEALAWYESHPKFLQASELIARLDNDVTSFKFERERGQPATGVETYIKTFEVTEDVAVNELKKWIENAWKDLNEGCLKPWVVSMDLLSKTINLARVSYVAYRFNDGFTFSDKTFKDCITLLLEDSIPK